MPESATPNQAEQQAKTSTQTSTSRQQFTLVEVDTAKTESKQLTMGEFLTGGTGMFYDGMQFKFTDAVERQIVREGETVPRPNAKRHVILLTSDPDVRIFASMFKNKKLDAHNHVVERDGTFDRAIIHAMNEANKDVTALSTFKAIVEKYRERTIVVRAKPYQGIVKKGNRIGEIDTFTLWCLDFAD